MSRFDFLHRALGASLGLAVACVSLPVFADTPVNVTFAPNSVWAQEVGSLDRFNKSVDYTVAGVAGKTFKLNLLTRSPNVQLKVKDQNRRKAVLDSQKTGDTSWTTVNATDTTYTIQVYIDPAAVPSGETVKYALQIGQYGVEDFQAPATAVTFEPGKPWAVQSWILGADATSQNFSVAIAAGMTVKVNVISSNAKVHFKVDDQTHGKPLVDTATSGAETWSQSVGAATTYKIQVYVDPAAVASGQKAQFTLQVGQYASGGGQPEKLASASSVAPPASSVVPESGH
jgi:hypothetical protein